MRDIAFIAAAALFLLAIVFAFFNRDSEKIITTLFLGVAALSGAIVAVSLFGAERPIRKAFSVPIMIHADTRLPVEGLPYPVLPWLISIRVREKLTAQPELLPDAKTDSFAQSTYHHVLQRAMILWLESQYPKTWQVDIVPMTLGEQSGYSFQSKQVPSRIYLPDELKAMMAGNQFADIEGPFAGGANLGLAVPKGTKLTFTPLHHDAAQGEISNITLHNRFCTITIDTRFGMSGVGAGSYRMLFGMSQEQAQQAFKFDEYSVIISVTYNPFLAGNPEMPKYKTWATGIADGLEAQFSDQIVWPKTKDWILFHRIAGN
ncbi:MAG: hypothetical protein WBF54_07070 [Terriglobales bacterium]